MAIVTAPVADFRGNVAGVDFVAGQGETDNDNALTYFRRHGYKVSETTKRAARKPVED